MESTNIYFIVDREAKAVKIGRSDNPEERLSQLQIGCPGILTLEYIIPGVRKSFETHVHGICKRYHISGEWFRQDVLNDHLLKHPYFIKNMRRKGC